MFNFTMGTAVSLVSTFFVFLVPSLFGAAEGSVQDVKLGLQYLLNSTSHRGETIFGNQRAPFLKCSHAQMKSNG